VNNKNTGGVMHNPSHRVLFVILSFLLSSASTVALAHDDSLELNLTGPTLRYNLPSTGTISGFIATGFPVMANLGVDYYPSRKNKGFYIQLDCPLTYKMMGHIPESDFDYDPNADYRFQLLMPGLALGGKFYISKKWFMRLGAGGSYPINVGSADSDPREYGWMLASIKLHIMVGVDI
jgi:hypothetical protein